MQRYLCVLCGNSFQSEHRRSRKQQALFAEYVWGRQSLKQLAQTTGCSHVWLRQQLDGVEIKGPTLTPQPIVAAADVTFWGREYGVCIFRAPTLKRNLWWQEVTQETPQVYRLGRQTLESQGFTIQAMVVDGKSGVARVFSDMPVQICQFHQVKTVGKHLTRHPKLPAAQELWRIALTLTKVDEQTFTKLLDAWHKRWQEFLNEKTTCSCCPRPIYTHRRLRAAYRSLKTNLPHLFTYLKYPELHIPNTTNCLDGMFSQLKNRLAVHRGLRQDRRYKIIKEILGGERN